MKLENKLCIAFVAFLLIMGVSAHGNKAMQGASAYIQLDTDSSHQDKHTVDSMPINEASVVDEVIWVVGDEPILKSEVEATRLQSEAEGIKYAGDPIVQYQNKLRCRNCSCIKHQSIVLRSRSRR